jgi:16S rRNA (adenine1518-N6/adenine1519-N6)-dimethyltransferase
MKGFKNIKIIKADVLKIKTAALNLRKYKLIGNLPFYIVSPTIRKFLEEKCPPKEMILMVQKEVAQRICAKPPDMNLLAVSVQFYAEPKILFYVSKNSFWPRPKVDGAVLKIIPLTNTNRELTDTKLFFKIVRAGFSQPRKQLVNNLSKMLKLDKEKVKNWLLKNGIQPSQRAETLNIEDWLKLTKNFKWKKR